MPSFSCFHTGSHSFTKESSLSLVIQFLASRILWTEEPGGLQSIWLQRVRHDLSDSARTHAIPITNILDCLLVLQLILGFPGGSDSKESAYNAGDIVLIVGSRRSPGEENGYSLQYSCLEKAMDRGAWWAIVHGMAELDMTEQLILSLHFP